MPEDGTVVQELPWYAKCSLDDVRCFIGANLKTVARCVVAVGYYLKQVRDRELWKDAEEAGYTSVWDFAHREFGISKSTASRYMSINDRFSEGGDSPLIMKQYEDLSKSQLQEMLYLTDQQAEAVTPETTVQQIRAMREPGPVEVLDGQMSLSDFLGDAPETEEQVTAESALVVHVSADDVDEVYKAMRESAVPCVVAMDDLIPEEEAAAVAISQQEDTVEQHDDVPAHGRRLIDADALIDDLEMKPWVHVTDYNIAYYAVKGAETVYDVTMVHGKWTADGHCSVCGEHALFWAMSSGYSASKFCPNCGARMDGEQA